MSASPVGDAEVVEDMLGSAIISRPPSSVSLGNDTRDKNIESQLSDEEVPISNEARDEDNQSEPMDLETDAGTEHRASSVISDRGRRASVEMEMEMEMERLAEEPPRKKQRTEAPLSRINEKTPDQEEVKVMQGDSYARILSGTYCMSLRPIHILNNTGQTIARRQVVPSLKSLISAIGTSPTKDQSYTTYQLWLAPDATSSRRTMRVFKTQKRSCPSGF
jgi:hypothetical protein